MKTGIILVEPLYSENIGLIARIMKNFDVKTLYLVNPKAGHLNNASKSRSMHAQDILRNAVKVKSLESLVKKFDLIVGTTAKLSKESKHFRKALSLKQFKDIYGKSDANIGLVFGREDIGLTNEELNSCDLTISINASRKYNTLNISHAVAVILHELFEFKNKNLFKIAEEKNRVQAIKFVNDLIEKTEGLKNKDAIKHSFKQLLSKTLLTEKEIKTLTGFFSKLGK